MSRATTASLKTTVNKKPSRSESVRPLPLQKLRRTWLCSALLFTFILSAFSPPAVADEVLSIPATIALPTFSGYRCWISLDVPGVSTATACEAAWKSLDGGLHWNYCQGHGGTLVPFTAYYSNGQFAYQGASCSFPLGGGWTLYAQYTCSGGVLTQDGNCSTPAHCPSATPAYSLSSDGLRCSRPGDVRMRASPKQSGLPAEDQTCSSQPASDNPIVYGTGNKVLRESDYGGSGVTTLKVVRTYNSATSNRTQYDPAQQWSNSLSRRPLFVYPTNATVVGGFLSPITQAVAARPNGRLLRFRPNGGAWVTDTDTNEALTELLVGGVRIGWRYKAADDTVEDYDAHGLLSQITSRDGRVQKFSYSDGYGGVQYTTTPQTNGYIAPVCNSPAGFVAPTPFGVLRCMTDAQGRQLNFNYDGARRLTQFADPSGQITTYTYDAANNLSTVTYPDNAVRTYVYNESTQTGGTNLPNALTGIIDEATVRYATYRYDSSGRAVGENLAGGADAATLSFGASGTNTTTVVDALGTARTYSFSTILGVQKSTGSSQPGGSGCAASTSALTYDVNGNIASRSDFNHNKICYAYDLARNLETKRVEGLTSSASCTTALSSPPAGARVISTEWHPYWRMRTRLAEPKRVTTLHL